MITTTLIQVFERDLDKLKDEIGLYESEEKLWIVKEGINNSGGNLCLHVCGSLQHFIGATLGETGYIRNREAEFKVKNVPKVKLLEEIQATRTAVTDTLEQVSKNELANDFPLQVLGEPVTTEYFLLFMLSHLNYHIGQINYHRRLM